MDAVAMGLLVERLKILGIETTEADTPTLSYAIEASKNYLLNVTHQPFIPPALQTAWVDRASASYLRIKLSQGDLALDLSLENVHVRTLSMGDTSVQLEDQGMSARKLQEAVILGLNMSGEREIKAWRKMAW